MGDCCKACSSLTDNVSDSECVYDLELRTGAADKCVHSTKSSSANAFSLRLHSPDMDWCSASLEVLKITSPPFPQILFQHHLPIWASYWWHNTLYHPCWVLLNISTEKWHFCLSGITILCDISRFFGHGPWLPGVEVRRSGAVGIPLLGVRLLNCCRMYPWLSFKEYCSAFKLNDTL